MTIPTTSAHVSNSSSPSSVRRHDTSNTSAAPSSKSLATISIQSSLTTSTPSSTPTFPTLLKQQISRDQTIVIESYSSPSSAPVSSITTGLSEKWTSSNASWTKLADVHLLSISLFLSPEDVARASIVCTKWKESLDKEVVWKAQHKAQGYAPIHPVIEESLKSSKGSGFVFVPSILGIIAEYDEPRALNYKAVFEKTIPNAILPRHYARFNNTQVVNPIPRPGIIRRENNKPDPDNPGRTIGETHIWTYRPGNNLYIDGVATILSIRSFSQLFEKLTPRDPALKFYYIASGISENQQLASMGEEGWYLMSKAVLNGTKKNIGYNEQAKIVQAKGYQVPSGPDVILPAMLWRVLTKERLFGQNPAVWTWTASLAADGAKHWMVGMFGQQGLNVGGGDIKVVLPSVGMTGVKNFSL